MSDAELSDAGDDDIVREHETQDENNEMNQDDDQDLRNVSSDEVMNDENGKNKENASTPIKKKSVRKMIVLNTERLKGSKGVHTIEKLYEGFKFKGKGHEKEDLDRVMKRLEYWGYRLFPKLEFDDFLAKCENLSHKKDLQTHLTKYRLDIINANSYATDEIVENNDSDDEILLQAESNLPVETYNENNAERLMSETDNRNNIAFQRLFEENQQTPQSNENTRATDDNTERFVNVTRDAQQISHQHKKANPQNDEQIQIVDDDEFDKLMKESEQAHENMVQTQQSNKSSKVNSEKTNLVIDDDEFEKLMGENGQAHENMVQTQQSNSNPSQINSKKTNLVIDDDDFDILMAETE